VFAPLAAWKIHSSRRSSPGLSRPSRARSHRCRRRRLPPDDCLPCGLLPFDVFPVPGSHLPWGYQLPGTCPLSVSHALRALLRPAPAGLVSCRSRPWGSTLQGRSPPAEPCVLSDAAALLWLAGDPGSSRPPQLPRAPGDALARRGRLSRRRRFRPLPHSRALLPASGRAGGVIVQANPSAATLVGFASLGDSPSPTATRPGVHPLAGLASGAHARPEAAPQSVVPSKRSAGLPRACRPFRGLPPCRRSRKPGPPSR